MAHFSFETGGSAQAPGTAQQPRQPLQFMSFDTQSGQYAGQSFAPPPPNAHVPYDANAYANVPVGGGMGGGGVHGNPFGGGMGGYSDDFDNEPPLLEELGINVRDIVAKGRAVLNPVRTNANAFEDNDLSGPLAFLGAMAFAHLLRGKVHFGILLGWSFTACVTASWVASMLAGPGAGVDVWRGVSVVGYCALPLAAHAAFCLVVGGWIAVALGAGAVAWATSSAANVIVGQNAQHLKGSWALVAYPCALYYSVLAMLTLY